MKTILITIAFSLITLISSAQLKGSGKTVTKTYSYSNFDKLNFEDLDGKIEVEIGMTWSISVTIDDNLFSLLAFKDNQPEKELTLYFKGNSNNKMYIENTNLKIKVTLPEASVICHSGNSVLNVKNVLGRYFRIENRGNAQTTISGTVDVLDIKNTGNGTTHAEKVITQKAQIKCTGNGNVKVNANEEITAKASGNGTVINYGKAKFDGSSSSTGNASLTNK
jgi:hypothetical protein